MCPDAIIIKYSLDIIINIHIYHFTQKNKLIYISQTSHLSFILKNSFNNFVLNDALIVEQNSIEWHF